MMAHIRIKNYGDTNKTTFIKDGVLLKPFSAFWFYTPSGTGEAKEVEISSGTVQEDGFVRITAKAAYHNLIYFTDYGSTIGIKLNVKARSDGTVKKFTTSYFGTWYSMSSYTSGTSIPSYNFTGVAPCNYPDGIYDTHTRGRLLFNPTFNRVATIENSKVNTTVDNDIIIYFAQPSSNMFGTAKGQLDGFQINIVDLII